MSINMINSQYLNLFGRSNNADKLSGVKAINIGKITGLKTSEETIGLSVSISKESKVLLRQLNQEKMQRELDLQPEIKTQKADSNSVKEECVENVNYLSGVSFIVNPDCYYARLFFADAAVGKYNAGEGRTGHYPCIIGTASAYAEIRKELESNYTGEELENRLQKLDTAYDQNLESMAESIASVMRHLAYTKQEPEGPWKNILKMVNINPNDLSCMDSLEDFLKNLKDSLISYGKLLRQYIIEGNAAPNTEEGKNAFNDYVKENMK